MSPMPHKLTVHLSAVTPLFLGGADPNERAELRPPSIKGLLRYWYRALDGKQACKQPWRGQDVTWEELLFGSTKTGQAPCLLSVTEWREGREGWERSRYSRPLSQGGYLRGGRGSGQNGLIYLGFSLTLSANNRKALPPGGGLTMVVVPRPQQSTEWDDVKATKLRHAWLAGLWLLVHVGGVGTRSRRGLGSLRIEGWDGWRECEELPLPSQASTPQEWVSRMESGLVTLRNWFPKEPTGDHTLVKRGARFLVVKQGHSDWEHALDDAGLRLQQFRRSAGPERAGFGLPLTFRNPRFRQYNAITASGRLASPLFVRVLRLGQSYHPAFISLPAPIPPPGQETKSWPQGAATVVRDFLDKMVKPDALEFTL